MTDHTLHPVIAKIALGLHEREGEIHLSEEAMKAARDAFAALPKESLDAVARDLVALAVKVEKDGGEVAKPAFRALVTLVVQLLGEDAGAARMSAAGVRMDAALAQVGVTRELKPVGLAAKGKSVFDLLLKEKKG